MGVSEKTIVVAMSESNWTFFFILFLAFLAEKGEEMKSVAARTDFPSCDERGENGGGGLVRIFLV